MHSIARGKRQQERVIIVKKDWWGLFEKGFQTHDCPCLELQRPPHWGKGWWGLIMWMQHRLALVQHCPLMLERWERDLQPYRLPHSPVVKDSFWISPVRFETKPANQCQGIPFTDYFFLSQIFYWVFFYLLIQRLLH